MIGMNSEICSSEPSREEKKIDTVCANLGPDGYCQVYSAKFNDFIACQYPEAARGADSGPSCPEFELKTADKKQ